MNHGDGHTPAEGGPARIPPAAAAARPDHWEDWFLRAAPSERLQAHRLARAQDPVQNPQPAASTNGPARQTLAQLLSHGQVADLPPIRPSFLDQSSLTLDADQRGAVARALDTPDICLIQGAPGSGKSRVVAEILRRAAQRGERVLFTASSGAALDHVLDVLGDDEALFPVRCLGAGETTEHLPVRIRRLVFAEQMRFFREQTLPAVRGALAECRAEGGRFERERPLWPTLEKLAQQQEALAAEKSRLQAQLQFLNDPLAELPSPSASFRQALAEYRRRAEECLAGWDERLRTLRTDIEKTVVEEEKCAAALASLTTLLEAWQGWRWWQPAWWRGLCQRNLQARHDALMQNHHALSSRRTCLAEECGAVMADRERELKQSEAERERLVALERARQCGAAEEQLAALEIEFRQAADAWRATTCGFLPATPMLAVPTIAELREAATMWRRDHDQAMQRLARAESWAGEVENAAASLHARLAAASNLVAGTLAGLSRDPHLGGNSSAVFDLLVVEDAEQITEAEFLELTRRAPRWVLVGARTTGAEAADGHRSVNVRSVLFQRIWQQLHPDPRRMPYRWSLRSGRLVCHLRPVSPDQERWLQSEQVADRPDIELRIVAPPHKQPQIAEVAFPAGCSASEAKQFLFRELEEFAIEADGPMARWEEDSDRVVLRLAAVPDPDAVPVVLVPGVHERVGCRRRTGLAKPPWQTCCLEFDRAAGWDRDRAEAWVAEHLEWSDRGRTAVLAVSRRAEPTLAAILAELLPETAALPPTVPSRPADNNGTTVEPVPAFTFVTVPSHGPEPEERRRPDSEYRSRLGGTATVTRVRPARGGAGLEIDLAEPRRLDPLPSDIRALLPRRGLVNFLEAQALVRTLEGLLLDPAFVHAAGEWQRGQQSRFPAVGVMALYPAQAHLLAKLVERCPTLTGSPLAIEIDVPAGFRHRQCYAVLVSLARSHTHRAVAYGDGPDQLSLALTRASGQLILFGDPGNLIRRCQWNGPVDHLGAEAAEREREFFTHILSYLQGHGQHAPSFRLWNGTGP